MAPANRLDAARKKLVSSAGPNFPKLATKETAQRSSYEEIQEDELIALASIYGEDFQRLDTKAGAWKRTEPSFSIRIKSSDEDLGITLHVVFVATYPRSVPLLSIKDDERLGEGTKFKVQKVIETKPKELLAEEQVMIMEIVDALREILEDAANAKAIGKEIPSLEQERAIHEAAAARIAREQEEMEERRRELEDKEEKRIFENMVQDELKRQRAKAREAKKKNRPPTTDREIFLEDDMDEFKERLIFDQPVSLVDENNNPRTFQAVTDKFYIRRGPVSNCYTVRPILKGNYTRLLALKQTDLGGQENDNANFKSQLRALESDLEALKKARHRNIVEVLDFKVHKTVEEDGASDNLWTVSILSEYADKGSLEEFLCLAGNLGVAKIRSWTIELLDALRYLHDRGIIHQNIHASNILLVRSPSGDVTVKIADASFQRQLHVLKGIQAKTTLTLAKSTYWSPPENANTSKPHYTQKTDVWDFGVVFLQMILGLEVLQKYASPERVTEALALSEPLNEIVHKFFKADPKKRPRAFELSSCEFLATDAPIIVEKSPPVLSVLGPMASHTPTTPDGQRRSSADTSVPFSRYREDFNEECRLGKGGFGEVVKARKKLDGQFYAIKKITQKSSTSLTEVLKEVRLLSQLSHPYVVRYYNTWTEETHDTLDAEEDTSSAPQYSPSAVSHDASFNIEFGPSTGGLDFISSSGYPAVEFDYESDDIESSEDEKDTEPNEDSKSTSQSKNIEYGHGEGKGQRSIIKRNRSDSRYQKSTRTILYIQMEYCEKRNLRDLIQRGIYKDSGDIWRLLRQMLEGLAHIHGLNIVHRDLKPENIFIDGALNVRIGDFGLATSGQYSVPDKVNASLNSHNMTTSIGTALYVAPEIRSSVGNYNSKVDMYSLGVILFEMCYPPMGAMERAHVLTELRQKKPLLPTDFNMVERAAQAEIILSLVSHNQKERPSSSELLQSGKLPVKMESEIIRQTLAGLSDPNSPYYQKMMGALFSRHTTQAKNFAWDMDTPNAPGVHDLMMQGVVKQKLISIFRRHGALETTRSCLFPRSGHYGSNVVQLLEPNGTLVQLPYDLTMPHARFIAKHASSVSRSFTFGHVFRDKSGCQPQFFGEVDFDIVSDSLDLALKEAEVIKVLDEIITDFPSFASTQMCFYINHSDLLNLIFEFCRIESGIRSATAEVLSKLNIQQWTWQKIRNELRSPLIGVSATSLDDLQRFDFRDSPSKAFQKIKAIFEGTDIFARASNAIAHISEVVEYLKRLEVHSKVFINPLSSLKENFYKGGILFSCLYDGKKKDVFAAGGRYDSLIREHRSRIGSHSEDRHAVGFSLSWEKLATSMARLQKSSPKTFLKKVGEEVTGIWIAKRCDVLVASFDPSILRSAGVELLRELWVNDISAELAIDSRSPEDLLSKYRDNQHYWVVFIKQDSSLRVKYLGRKDVQDIEIPIPQLVGWLKGEIRDRDHRESNSDNIKPRHQITSNDHEQDVRVLVAQAKSKKSNRRNIVDQAQMRAASLVHSFLDGPIAAIETTDHVMELIRETRLSDGDSWLKVSQNVPTTDKKYIGEVHSLMKTLANQNKDTTRNAFIYNIRTGNCIYYDMGA